MESFVRVQTDIQQQIQRGFRNFKKSPKDRITLSYLETRLESLEKQWEIFNQTHKILIMQTKSEEYNLSNYSINDDYGATEELYTEYKVVLKEHIASINVKPLEKQRQSTPANDDIDVKLPAISVPAFSGNYAEWTTFRDLFVSLIHNNRSLTNVQKLQYLKTYLRGEAEQLLRHVPVASDNYLTCWNALEHRFNNRKYITNSIFDKFFKQKPLNYESSINLKQLLDTSNECLNALKNLGINIENWDIIIIYILREKLDTESRKLWEAKSCSFTAELPNLSEFLEFLEHRFRSLEFMDTKVVKVTKSLHVVNNATEFKSVCILCSETSHKLGNCKQFAEKDLSARRNFVQQSGLCYNCLGANHSVAVCRLSSRCRICKKKHHSLLHADNINQSTDTNETTKDSVDDTNVVVTATTLQNETEVDSVVSCFSSSNCQVILATALVNAESNTGSYLTLRSLLDQGSQASFITESAAQLLGLRKIQSSCVISGIGGEENTSLNSNHVVDVKLQSIQDPTFTVNVTAHVLKKLTSVLPEKKVMVQLWSNLPKMKLADRNFNIPSSIDLVLGAEVYCQILSEGLITGPPGTPIAQNTKLGWILSGKVGTDNDVSAITNNTKQNYNSVIAMHVNVNNEEFNLKQFWELESDIFDYTKTQFTPEEQRCEDIYQATTKRDSLGRYITTLPFRDADPKCKYGNSLEISSKRFLWLENRFKKFPKLKRQYSDVISEYLKLGHMQVVPQEEIVNSEAVYLPYHEVIRNDKTTTKFRVVFNASSRDCNGVSLNSDLMVGPTIQSDLRHLLMRWRRHPICLVADIVKMYRQVCVSNHDADFQRLIWRFEDSDELQHLRLVRVTFGTASAPYLAVRTLHQLAHDEGKDLPLAAERLLQDFYVDDLLTGCKTASEGKQIVKELNTLLNRGGFELQKWSSNNEQILEEISGKNEAADSHLELKKDEILRILGLNWNRSADCFEYSVQLPPISKPVTKRKVVSDIASLFDPMGWISPAIVNAKIMIQRLWLSGIKWDDELPQNLLSDWITYRAELTELTKFQLSRWIHTNNSNESVELHGFSDASNAAYAAVVYMRVVDESDKVHVHLITSKTKVAPIKQVSIPRLELCGAVLLAKLLKEVSLVLNVSKTNLRAWTDSTVVLAWLSSHPSRWKTFIANRVSEILNILDRNQWAHVSSVDNPADCASRGITPSKLSAMTLWKSGPLWLQNRVINFESVSTPDTHLEERKGVFHTADVTKFELFSKFSSFQKMIRVLAYCMRFIKLSRKLQTVKVPTWLTSRELNVALHICVKQYQAMSFQQEISHIQERGIVDKKSKLASFNPFLDDAGILRVGGRLERSSLKADTKHPIIIPAKSHLTDLIIDEAHKNTLHGGPQLMLNVLRSKYWIINAKNQVKMFIRKCVVCVRYSAETRNQLMGQLPPARATPMRPFFQSGVDYAGPIQIRTSKGRGHQSYKGYICLFVCMATRAVHLEAVSDLTSTGFLAAFKRFVARRGHCADLYSDNGTNFVGAARELRILFTQERSTLTMEIAECLANNGTTWHFIPPHTPHFGGLWEAGIKSTKHHLRRVIGNSTLTFEELSTLLYQIEACLNSRPLSILSTNSQDPTPLTPGHFLIGEPLLLAPETNYETSSLSSLKRWQLTQKMLQHFWRRWSSEYLTQFLQRYKWAYKTPEPDVGDVVLVKEDNLPPAQWLLGIISEKHPGLDNITRVVTVKCKGITFKRPTTKLCILPVTQ